MGVTVGAAAPAFSCKAHTGATVSLSDFAGKKVCSPCQPMQHGYCSAARMASGLCRRLYSAAHAQPYSAVHTHSQSAPVR